MIILTAKQEQRFHSYIGPINARGCREWTKSTRQGGYGAFGIYGKLHGAHRIAWVLANKQQIPKGIKVCHTCDNPPCCEPSHLFLGTAKDNAQDREVKGRGGMAKLTKQQVREARNLYATGKYSQAELARRYRVHVVNVGMALRGVTFAHVVLDKPYVPVKHKGKAYVRNHNGEKNPSAKLTEAQVREIRAKYYPGYGMQNLADEYGISFAGMEGVVYRRTWKHIV